MLKAIDSDAYASFISGLTEMLKAVVISSYGVFDKFTGDGLLAYFPVFYSGEAAVLNSLIAAKECHKVFQDFYKKSRSRFSVVVKTGLGLGIDYGNAKLVMINDEQTIVGTPVVYACRMSSSPANHTFINQSALDKITSLGRSIQVRESEIDLKNEGLAVVYEISEIESSPIDRPIWT